MGGFAQFTQRRVLRAAISIKARTNTPQIAMEIRSATSGEAMGLFPGDGEFVKWYFSVSLCWRGGGSERRRLFFVVRFRYRHKSLNGLLCRRVAVISLNSDLN